MTAAGAVAASAAVAQEHAIERDPPIAVPRREP